jgi:glucuronokinase
MVALGRSLGAHVTFTGSGGAVIGDYENAAMYRKLERSFTKEGYKVFKPRIE